jgi:hypothetical protein
LLFKRDRIDVWPSHLAPSPKTILHYESTKGKEATDNKSNTDISGVLRESILDTVNTVLAWRTICNILEKPEETRSTDTTALEVRLKSLEQIHQSGIYLLNILVGC